MGCLTRTVIVGHKGGSFKESSVSRAMAVRETVTVGRKGGVLKKGSVSKALGAREG